MKTIEPTYTHCLVQAGNSLRKFCGLPRYHESLSSIDAWVEEQKITQLAVFLIDGMGNEQVEEFLDRDGFFYANRRDVIQSVYPSTTVAATTALRSGLLPSESGYLGWHQYFPDLKDSVVMFTNHSYYGKHTYPNSVLQRFPISFTIAEAVASGVQAIELFPWTKEGCDQFSGLCKQTQKELQDGAKMVYAYWDGYDAHMHEYGVHTPSSIKMLQEIEFTLASFCQQLPEHVGVLILADHGHIDIKEISLLAYPDLCECLRFPPTLEVRTANFYVKEGKETQFQTRFQQLFQDSFILYTQKEAIAKGLFGEKGKQPKGEESLGTFIACAISDVILTYGDAFAGFAKGYHAGMSKAEMEVPLILYTK